MGDIHIHDGGGWTDIANMHVNTGSWNPVKQVYIHNGSGWVSVWQNEITETFPFSAGQTYYGTVADQNGYFGQTRLNTTRGNKNLVQGEYGGSAANQRGLWIPGNGSVSGTGIAATLNGRTIKSFKISLGVSWTYWGRFHGDGKPARAAIYGTNQASIPTTLNPSVITYLGVISFYPQAVDYSAGFATITEAQLGINTVTQGNRYPQFKQDIDITSQLSSTAKTQLTNGTIDGFIIQAYNKYKEDLTGNVYYYNAYLEPGESYTTSNVPATGNSDAFRIKVTHTG